MEGLAMNHREYIIKGVRYHVRRYIHRAMAVNSWDIRFEGVTVRFEDDVYGGTQQALKLATARLDRFEAGDFTGFEHFIPVEFRVKEEAAGYVLSLVLCYKTRKKQTLERWTVVPTGRGRLFESYYHQGQFPVGMLKPDQWQRAAAAWVKALQETPVDRKLILSCASAPNIIINQLTLGI